MSDASAEKLYLAYREAAQKRFRRQHADVVVPDMLTRPWGELKETQRDEWRGVASALRVAVESLA